ncbi:ATP-grasp domain-containing protein [Gammaproteobacteria bacterium]|nr:ATP-grasp domain-containing protein [Gammaproteobacteria bacterium]
MTKTLMIIGAGAEQVPAYYAAKAKGLNIVGSDMNLDAPGLELADYKLQASTRDPIETLQKVKELTEYIQIDGVMTIANDVPLTVATVADFLKLPSIGIDSAKIASDKHLMKKCFQAHGVACPNFYIIHTLEDLQRVMNDAQASQRFVLKPIDGRGARGVLLINNKENLDWAFAEALSHGSKKYLLLEEFIEGKQFSTESFLLEGKCFTAGVAERNYKNINKFAPYIIEDGGDINYSLDPDILGRIDDLILKGAQSMGIFNGVIKGDIVIDHLGNPQIIELAARLSGGWFASHQIPKATGIDLVSMVISLALNEKIDKKLLIPTIKNSTSIRYWYPEPGKITKIEGIECLESSPGLIKYGFFKNEGEFQDEIKMHSDRFGFVIVQAENALECSKRVNQALSCVQIKVS